MTPPNRKIGLRTGLICLALVGIFGAIWFSSVPAGPVREAPPAPSEFGLRYTARLSDPASMAFLSSLERAAPEAHRALTDTLEQAVARGVDDDALAKIMVRAILAEFQRQALTLRYADTRDFDRLLDHVRTGLTELEARQSPWCEATEIEALVRQSTPDLIETVESAFTYGSAQYAWLMQWASLYLDTAMAARRTPAAHGPRTARDKTILQAYGRQIGAEQWALALQIATFSQAEGQSYDAMRQTLAGIDVCRLGVTAIDLSDRLPEPVRGRIWAELLPEIMYGNTPYAMYLVTNYFFLD